VRGNKPVNEEEGALDWVLILAVVFIVIFVGFIYFSVKHDKTTLPMSKRSID
jgi:heme/copper-type cytochrome/quinol oxidase subunit 2